MNKWFNVCYAEMQKHKANYFNTWTARISAYVWPLLVMITLYYSYAVFNVESASIPGISSREDLLEFLIIGLAAYNLYWMMVQSARLLLKERENGTVEITFLSPACRTAIVYGRAMGGLRECLGQFVILFVCIIFIKGELTLPIIMRLSVAAIVLCGCVTIWGAFLNTMYLIARDVGFWFTVCDAPMGIFSGSKIPISALPVGFQAVAAIFPLTYSLNTTRSILADELIKDWHLMPLVISNGILVIITYVILVVAERHNRRTGNLQLY